MASMALASQEGSRKPVGSFAWAQESLQGGRVWEDRRSVAEEADRTEALPQREILDLEPSQSILLEEQSRWETCAASQRKSRLSSLT